MAETPQQRPRNRNQGAYIPVPQSPVTGAPITPGSPGYDPWGYVLGKNGRPNKSNKVFGGHHFMRRLFKGAPPFLADLGMYNTSIGTINDILNRHGATDPEALQRQQAMLETQRQQAGDVARAQAAQAGQDPNSVQYQLTQSGIQQGSDIAQQLARFNESQAREQRMREDLNLVTPYMQMLMGYTGPKNRNSQITPAPVGSSSGTNWAGVGANLLGSFIQSPAFSNMFQGSSGGPNYVAQQQDWWGRGNQGPV